MRTLRSAALLATAVAFATVACDRSPPPRIGDEWIDAATQTRGAPATVRASGSSAMQPLVNAAKERYEALHPAVSIEVSAGGSNKGLVDVASGAVQIGDSDIFAPEGPDAGLVDHRVAVVGFAAMANRGPFNANITALTRAQLAQVFEGRITSWQDLGGAAQPIVVINRPPGSGTRMVFASVVLGSDRFVEGQTEDNSGALVAKLKQTKGAISYLALSFADPALVTLAWDTPGGLVVASPENIASGAYPLWAYQHMYTRGEARAATRDFLDYVLSSEFQTNVVPTLRGFLPVTRMKVTREHD